MDREKILEVKKKKEYSALPDSIVEKALEICKGEIKETRAYLRKYFGVFMTNKVTKGEDEKVLESHISSKKRNYGLIYEKLLAGKNFKSVVDMGSGVNGFSYPIILEHLGEVRYFGLEATKRLVDNSNKYFTLEGFKNARSFWVDLFETEKVLSIIREAEKPLIIFIFQVIDALESMERNYSKKLLADLKKEMGHDDRIVVSSSLRSISGRQKFNIKRSWLAEFLAENFEVEDSFEMFDEGYIVIKKSKGI